MNKKRASLLSRYLETQQNGTPRQASREQDRHSSAMTPQRTSEIKQTFQRMKRFSVTSQDQNLTFLVEKIKPRFSHHN